MNRQCNNRCGRNCRRMQGEGNRYNECDSRRNTSCHTDCDMDYNTRCGNEEEIEIEVVSRKEYEMAVEEAYCQRFRRVVDQYNHLEHCADKSFDQGFTELTQALEHFENGMDYSSEYMKIHEKIHGMLGQFDQMNSGCAQCRRNTTCSCENLRDELQEMVDDLMALQEQANNHTLEALRTLEEAKELDKCIHDLRIKMEKECYPRC